MKSAILITGLLLAAPIFAASKPDLNAKTTAGEKVRLKDLRGKLVVLNFWATWCAPCKDELPMLVKIAQANSNADVQFIAVSVDDTSTRGAVPDSAKRLGISFPVWIGPNGDDLYRISKGEGVPATVFIDRDGSVLASVSGQITEAELKERLDWLSGPRTGPKPKEFISHIH